MNYTLGDKWSPDFDYEGMLDMALETSVEWEISDLKKLSDSFESVNYHSLNEHILNVISELERGNVESAEELLLQFHAEIIKFQNDEFEEDLKLILNLVYPDVKEVCRRNGLDLNESYYLSDGGEYHHPSIITLKDEEDDIEEITIGYFDDDDDMSLAFINVNLKNKELNLNSDYWQIDDAEKLSIYKSGGDLDDRGVRPSPKESATIFKEGTRKRGQDGNMWEVVVAKNGVKRWKKIGDSKKEPRERKPNPKSGSSEKEPKESKEPKKESKHIYDYNEKYQEILRVLEQDFSDKSKIDIIEDRIGKFLMLLTFPLIDGYDGTLNGVSGYIPFNCIRFKKSKINKNEIWIDFITYNKKPVKKENELERGNLNTENVTVIIEDGAFADAFVYNIGKASFTDDEFQGDFGGGKSSGRFAQGRFDTVPQIIKNIIISHVDGEWRYMMVEDLYANIKEGDRSFKNSDYYMTKEMFEYRLEEFIEPQQEEEPPQKTGINDWIFEVGSYNSSKTKPLVADWMLYSVNDKKLIFRKSKSEDYLVATPNADKNIIEVFYNQGNSDKETLIKTIKKGVFSSLQEYLEEMKPVIVRANRILKYKEGGEVNDDNLYMLQNQSVQFTHHSKELKEALEKNPKVDAWVVAKAERAATDLSDITHYLDGKNEGKYENGGSVKNLSEILDTLKDTGIKISKPTWFYNGSNYGQRYVVIDSGEIEGRSDYLGVPIMKKKAGFIAKNGMLQNFYFHNGEEYLTSKDINWFINKIKNQA